MLVRSNRSLVAALVLALCGCAKVQPITPDMSPSDGGRRADLAGADLLQIEEHDMSLCGSCDDQIPCTVDVCLSMGKCDHVPDHGKCADRQLCTATGCVAVETTKLCTTCSTDADCGADELCTTLPSGDMAQQQLCLPRCGQGGACPKGFACDPSRSRCVPNSDSGLCCYDGDGDQRGLGSGCLGSDCDDSDAEVYTGHPETCDGKDNDCNGQKDEGYLCGGPTCAAIGTTGNFSGSPIPQCLAGKCEPPTAVACGRYTCQSVTDPVSGNTCRVSCSGVDDTACVSSAYCDGASCAAQLPNGAVCGRDRACQSGHCQNGHCCGSGDCCATATDCAAGVYSSPTVCDAPTTSCQGHREDRTCTQQKTCAKLRVDDDSACGSSISISCAPLQPQSCNGAVSQTPLACPTTCTKDSDCVSSAWCSSGTCVARMPDGGACTAANQCGEGRSCLNGFCCSAATGACCGVAADCPPSFASPATCDAPLTSCQGHRVDKTCVSNICGSQTVDDDSVCSASISKSCGAYQPVTCSALTTQSPLVCPASCINDSNCVQPQNHCLGGTCQPWVENGGACSSAGECRSGFCVSGNCCQAACNATSCDSCGGGTCNPFADPLEAGNVCLDTLPDIGTGAFTASVTAYLQSSTDDEDWYQFYATDAANACGGFIRVQLTVPAGVDYDVYLYSIPDGSCGSRTLLAAGLSATGNEDQRWNEGCSTSDEGWYLVRVKRYSGASCTLPYTLTVDARL